MKRITADELGTPRVRDLLRHAAAWRLLGLLLERPRDGWRQEVEALSREVSDPEITAAAVRAQEEAAEGLYLALLGPGGAVSPREVTYRGMEDPGHIMADIMAFYEAFAFRPTTEEAPDHLAVEAGFLGYVCLKEAFAQRSGHAEEAEVASRAAERFRETHLTTFAWPVADRLGATGVRYLAITADVLARRAGPRRETMGRREGFRSPCEGACPLECGQ